MKRIFVKEIHDELVVVLGYNAISYSTETK
jgi:hypothetical protein